MPLKTYLPDGDIDLTVASDQNNEEGLARDICNILRAEEQGGTRFLVRGVQYIPAQVKIVKCFVENIAVDISFNQMAGICSLCFLEQVDQLIGKDHLYKRSILLIKAWCYYESRILGAHHGLISTYALETLILYIINMFHSSLGSPLAVLFKFLDYYSTFEWDRYCITLYGRVAIPSLPNIVVEREENNGCDLLLTKEFLENSVQYFLIPARTTETREHFPVKFMNIMDPLKSNNNLGRSVNKGNLYRIKSALNLGTRKLRQILMGPAESMDAELKLFFATTLDRNLGGGRPDVQFRFPVFGDVGRRGISNLGRNYGNYVHGPYYSQDHRHSSLPVAPQPRPHISHSLAQNVTPCMQYRWNDFSQTKMHEFIPREIGHQNASQFLTSPLGVQEQENFLRRGPSPSRWSSILQNAMSRASGTHIPNVGAENPNSQGTGTFIPTLTIREMRVPRGTGTVMPDMGAEMNMNLEGTSNYSPHIGENKEMGMEGKANWQGPGTSIADKSYIDVESWDYKKKRVVEWVEVDLKEAQNEYESCFDLSNEEFSLLSSSRRALASESGPSGADNDRCSSGTERPSLSHGPHSVWPTAEIEEAVERNSGIHLSLDELPLLPTKSEPSVAAPPEGRQSVQPLAESEDKAGSSGSFFKLSPEEFPLLPSQRKAVFPETREPVRPAAAESSEAAPKSSARTMSMKFGAFWYSPPPPSAPSSPASKEPDSGVSTPGDPILGFQTAATSGPLQESSDHNEEVVVAEGYQLEDEKDFPPLSL